MYDFNRVIERTNTACIKWDALNEVFGTTDALPMWVADMDFQSPPPVIEAIKRRAEHGIYGYTIRESYFDSLIQWLARRHSWSVHKEWLLNVPGVLPALAFIIETFTEPGDKIVIQHPVYYPFSHLIQRNGRDIVSNPLKFDGSRYSMDFADLEEKLSAGAKMFILCNPHNPVGRVWSREELTRLGNICLKHNVLVVSDEIHCDLVYPGHSHRPFASIDEAFANSSLTCVSASKTFNVAGLQTATVIAPNEALRKAFEKTLNRYALGGANVFGVVAAESAYTYGEEWLEDLRQYLADNLQYVTTYIHERIPQLQVIQPEGTYLVWIDCRRLGLSRQELKDFFLHEAKVALDMGHIFGPQGEGFVRMNIACPRSTLMKALEQIETAVRERLARE
jgi:cystathionine beta-lyase